MHDYRESVDETGSIASEASAGSIASIASIGSIGKFFSIWGVPFPVALSRAGRLAVKLRRLLR